MELQENDEILQRARASRLFSCLIRDQGCTSYTAQTAKKKQDSENYYTFGLTRGYGVVPVE